MAKPIHLDGTTLEGGGQLFRLALSLSSLTGTAINVTDIRGNRGSKPGKDAGIKPAHLAGGLWLAGATNAETNGLELRSRNMIFSPYKGPITSRESEARSDGVFDAAQFAKGRVTIAISTPGSVFLILQSILPFLLFASSGTSSEKSTPIKVILEGGTNVWHSLSYEYAEQVYFPMLHQKLGFDPISMKLHKRGWSLGKPSIGKVEIDITPLETGQTLPAFEYTGRGEITTFRLSIFAQDPNLRTGIRKLVSEKLLRLLPEVDIEVAKDECSEHPSRLYLLIVAESENGYRIGRDWLYDQKINKDKPMKTVDILVTKVVRDIQQEIAHGGCVDEWLQDQFVVFQALSEGKCVIDGREPSLHTQTARWVAEEILGVKFNASGHCRGIALKAVSRESLKDEALLQNLAEKVDLHDRWHR